MNTRQLTPSESANLARLNSAGCKSVLLFITQTVLDKSIFDATEPMRKLFKDSTFHDFALQQQGKEHKVIQRAVVLLDEALIATKISLYRPITKHGDPRFCIYEFKRLAAPGDVCAIMIQHGCVHIMNLSRSKLDDLLRSKIQTPTIQFFSQLKLGGNAVSNRLLGLLKEIAARGPLKAVCTGDTAIGRTIESALGIPMNSSRNPDFHGIELKSGRSKLLGRQNRAGLFACVPDWKLSSAKGSREILEWFGYRRGADFQLYCEVSCSRANSQGLQLKMNDAEGWLKEICVRPEVQDVCIWRLDELHERLTAKHNETFWLSAKSLRVGAGESFELKSVTHTTEPDPVQFDRLLSDGTITLDHIIKRQPSGGAKERGPQFKIERHRLNELFLGEFQKYSLVE